MFSGRLSRRQFEYGLLLSLAVYVVWSFVAFILLTQLGINQSEVDLYSHASFYPLALILGFFIWSLTVRRLHDIGSSGLFAILLLAPLLGLLMIIYLLFVKGEETSNKYGNSMGNQAFWPTIFGRMKVM